MRSLPRFLLSLGFAMPLTLSIAMADDVRDRFEKREYKDSQGHVLPYRLLKPTKIAEDELYPLVIFLHGAGERGSDNEAQLVHGMSDFASDKIMEKYPAFVIAPQCPQNKQWVNVPWSADSHVMPKEPAEPLRQTFEVIEQLQKEFPIDPKRLYITGLSMGGYATWDAIQRHPKLFAAAAPICGGGDASGAATFQHVPLWVFHGDQDTAVRVARSRDMIAALKKAGGSPRYTEYPGVGHDSWTATYRNEDFYKWLFAQQLGKQD